MTAEQAINILNDVTSKIHGDREVHLTIIEAVAILRNIVGAANNKKAKKSK